ncbi:UPF0481 protein At3g47200-like [Cornus florida]|uniref:UPF0481 protein At3g47200-like n=1 Tax=Cornus florida TaxID=4283 RepID=UPI00289913DD|nr:UPF0481 protein At3g47200-like [Cornus florida]
MAKSDDGYLSNINWAEARNEASNESGAEITADEWIISILKESLVASSHKRLSKVPPQLREKEENKGFFDPRVVSIGPYHHGKPELKEVEKFKTKAVRAFIDGSKVEPHVIYNKMVEVVSDVRNCYLEGSTDAYDDTAFARMMLLDGCFLLHFIYINVSPRGPFLDELVKHVGEAGMRGIIADIILLENQLPFRVLQVLISSSSSAESVLEEFIENFVVQVYIDNNATWRKQTYKQEVEQPIHFLDLVRRRFIITDSRTKEVVVSSSSGEKKVPHQTGSFKTINIPCWRPKSGNKKRNPLKDVYSHSFRSATELKARGIHFRPSNTFSLNDSTFTSQFGYGLLTLPQLKFDWGIKYALLNMMAYELAPNSSNRLEVCNYIYFMNSLINGTEDVIELRTHNIIHNFYGTDEEVAKTFNSMATGGGYLSLEGPIKDVSDQIQEHYNSRMKTWTAQLLHNYFSNPWSAVAFFAATFALVLTFIQTFFPR